MVELINHYILTILVFSPLLASGLLFIMKEARYAKIVALLSSIFTFLLTLHLWYHLKPEATLQFVEMYPWIPELGAKYILGVDGLNILLIVLTGFLTILSIISVWHKEDVGQSKFLGLLLLLECGMLGALVSFDLLLFYIFWEVMLIPMYFIIGMWGGSNRIYATTKFVIYTVFGSLLMLVAALYLYILHAQEFGFYSTNLLDLYQMTSLPRETQLILFSAFALAFAIKVPIWPFHTWLPHAHTEAPTVGSVILAGIMLKMGNYGFLRFALPLFPEALPAFGPILFTLGIVGIIYGALVAWQQEDAKKLVAYSSVSHLGFVVIGSVALIGSQLSVEALTGSIYQMINHGISTPALFFLVGVIYERKHTRNLSEFGGLATVMPWFSVMLIIATLGSVGLPGTGGFVGEFFILLGSFGSNPLGAILAASGVLLGAVYMLKFCRDILFGELKDVNKDLQDITCQEWMYIAPLAALIIAMGIFPNVFLDKIRPSIHHLAQNISQYRLSLNEEDLAHMKSLNLVPNKDDMGRVP